MGEEVINVWVAELCSIVSAYSAGWVKIIRRLDDDPKFFLEFDE